MWIAEYHYNTSKPARSAYGNGDVTIREVDKEPAPRATCNDVASCVAAGPTIDAVVECLDRSLPEGLLVLRYARFNEPGEVYVIGTASDAARLIRRGVSVYSGGRWCAAGEFIAGHNKRLNAARRASAGSN